MSHIITSAYNVYLPSLVDSNLVLRRFPLFAETLVDNRQSTPHWHDYTQIWYTISGEYYHTVNGVRIKQTPGSAAFVFPFAMHNIDSSASNLDELRVISISVRNDAFSGEYSPLSFSTGSVDTLLLTPFISLSGKEKERADELFEGILREYNRHFEVNTGKLLTDAFSFIELCAKSMNVSILKSRLLRAKEEHSCISRSLTEMNTNKEICDSRTLDIACNFANMSRRSYTQKFKYVTGQTFSSYIKADRMGKALWLLHYSDLSNAEIAEQCGFSDSSHFVNCCKEMFGISPRAIKASLLTHDRTFGEHLHALDIEKYGWLRLWNDADIRCENNNRKN